MDEEKKTIFQNKTVLIVVILIAAWMIGMSIIIAGWIISKQIAEQNINLQAADASASKQPVKSSKVEIAIPEKAPMMGKEDAKVTMVMFADFQCPFCKKWQDTVYPQLKSKYIDTGMVKLVYMNFPFLGAESTRAAQAAYCAKDQDKFWEYHDLLFKNQGDENSGVFTDDNLKKFATSLKLNTELFKSCLNTNQHEVDIDSDLKMGNQIVVDSTPTLFINGYRYEGIFKLSDYESAIDLELQR